MVLYASLAKFGESDMAMLSDWDKKQYTYTAIGGLF